MKKRMLVGAVSLAVLAGLVLSAQDKYTAKVPGGLGALRIQRVRIVANHLRQSTRKGARGDPRKSRDDQCLSSRDSRQRKACS